MNKKEIIDSVAKKSGFKKICVDEVINTMLNSIVEELSKGNKVTLSGFGTFYPKYREARKCRDINDGTEIIVEGRTVPAFKASVNFKEIMKK